MQHKDGQTLRGLAILLLSIQGLLDSDGGQRAGELDQHRRQQRQLILAQILGDGNGKGVHRCGKGQRIKVLLCHSTTPFLYPMRNGVVSVRICGRAVVLPSCKKTPTVSLHL